MWCWVGCWVGDDFIVWMFGKGDGEVEWGGGGLLVYGCKVDNDGVGMLIGEFGWEKEWICLLVRVLDKVFLLMSVE